MSFLTSFHTLNVPIELMVHLGHNKYKLKHFSTIFLWPRRISSMSTCQAFGLPSTAKSAVKTSSSCEKETCKAGCKLSAAASLFLNDADASTAQLKEILGLTSEINQRPQRYSSLVVNSGLEAVALASTKLDVLGVKLYVSEVKKLKFYILLREKSKVSLNKSIINSTTADSCPCQP